mgnify:CR=1 FL=1
MSPSALPDGEPAPEDGSLPDAAPCRLLQDGLTALRLLLSAKVVPLLSRRATSAIVLSGMERPGLAAAIRGSDQRLISPPM